MGCFKALGDDRSVIRMRRQDMYQELSGESGPP